MALPKLFQRIFWHNNATPAINEDNLNAMSKGLSDVDDRLISLAGTIMEDVPQIQQDIEDLEALAADFDTAVQTAQNAATSAQSSASNANAKALVSEGWAKGTQNGTAVGSSSPYYHNNAEYFKNQARSFTPEGYQDLVDDVDSLKGAYTENVNVNGSKNVLPLSLALLKKINTSGSWNGNTYSINNASFTVNTNVKGDVISISLSTTSATTAQANLRLVDTSIKYAIPNGDYVLSKGNSNTNTTIFFNAYSGSTLVHQIASTSDDHADMTLNYSDYDGQMIAIGILSGKTASNVMFYPMICLATDYGVDPTFSPWAKTNRQLTEDSVTWSDEAKIGAVNVFPVYINRTETSSNGVSVVFDNDGIMTFSGTPSANSLITCSETFVLKKGTYKISGSPYINDDTVQIGISVRTDSSTLVTDTSKSNNGAENIFTISADTSCKMYCYVKQNFASTGMVCKPIVTPILDYTGPYAPYAKTNKELTDDVTPSSVTSSVTSTVGTIDSSTTAYKIGKVVYVSGKITLTEAVAKWGKILTIDIGQNFAQQYAFSAAWDYTNERIIPMQVGYGVSGTLKVELMQAVASGVELRFDFYGILR